MNLKVELEQAAKSVPAQGQGLWRIEILFPETATDLLLSATQGDELAARMLSMLFQAINVMARLLRRANLSALARRTTA